MLFRHLTSVNSSVQYGLQKKVTYQYRALLKCPVNFSIFLISTSALEVITHVIQMQHVQTLKVLINVNADECCRGNHTCDPNATCTNTEGSYQCQCNTGYTGDGHHCTGIFKAVENGVEQT